jgi:hypothetical protein
MSLLVSYIFRRFIFTPLNQQNNSQQQYNTNSNVHKKAANKDNEKLGEYTDYEEIK